MRTARLLSVILTVLFVGSTGSLLLTPSAGAQPPLKLTEHVTDNAKVLDASGRAAVTSAVDKLYADRQIQLWVVYIDNFSGQTAVNWAKQTKKSSDLGDKDLVLAISTAGRGASALLVQYSALDISEGQVNELQDNSIKPKVQKSDWAGAAVAAAQGLDKSPSRSGRVWLVIGLVAAVVLLVIVFLVVRYIRRRRRARTGGGDLPELTGSLDSALAAAESRVRQISDYIGTHSDSVGAEAKNRFEDANQHLRAARAKKSTNTDDAIAYANAASTIAANAQSLANSDVLSGKHVRRG